MQRLPQRVWFSLGSLPVKAGFRDEAARARRGLLENLMLSRSLGRPMCEAACRLRGRRIQMLAGGPDCFVSSVPPRTLRAPGGYSFSHSAVVLGVEEPRRDRDGNTIAISPI